MFCEPDREMIEVIKQADISRKEICQRANIRYSRLNAHLNGFSEMDAGLRSRVMRIIRSAIPGGVECNA
jgi:hypothetical protein